MNNQGSVLVDNCDFDDSYVHIENNNFAPSILATISDCDFANSNNYTAIRVEGCNTYNIDNNTIDNYMYGIEVWNSGHGKGDYFVKNNSITNIDGPALTFYSSSGIIENNQISNNDLGVKLLNNSSVQLIGNSNANYESQTQVIKDNIGEEVYMSSYSVPQIFHYNVIKDNDNLGGSNDALVYHNLPPSGQPIIDVEYNCWGGSSFNPLVDLYPVGAYDSDPTWCPGLSKGVAESAEILYMDSQTQFEDEEFIASKTTLETIITDYPNTTFAQAAVKDLFIVELFATNDYSSLRQYFNDNPSIQTNDVLKSLAEFFSNRCDIKLENWQTAIDFYEARISGEPDTEEEIFAIIDLGLLYYIMENSSNKASYGVGSMPEHKPKSKEEYIAKRDYLISLLPLKSKEAESLNPITSDEVLSQNSPNPVNGNTQIGYNLEQEANIQLNVYDYTGKLLITIDEGKQDRGAHHINLNTIDLENGIYLYTIKIDGQVADSKKMVVLK
ncbi:T9SS type A sorting domain-containing protein [Lentimicrobium sp. S6]|uniref:T9SS type A sorting domain-containing protein n=2 Tax=unclassified Lentimicrobium TaxID=2677434 RepID=UPI001554129E|nr:T9SS type A sorting domain-containing protein [Lentimicrobium sp. S6]